MQKDKNDIEIQNGVQGKIGTLDGEKLKIFDSFKLKSLCGHQASFLCASSQCQQDAVICNSFCEACKNRHQTCVDAKIAGPICQNIDKRIIELVSQDKSILKQIEQKADKIVDNVSLLTRSLERQIKLLGLNQSDRDLAYCLLKRLNSKTNKDVEIVSILSESQDLAHDNQKFCGETINQIFEENKFSSKNWFNQSIHRFKSIMQKSKQMVTSYFDEIQDCILKLHTNHYKTVDSKCYFSSSKILRTKLESFWNANLEKHLKKAGINGLSMEKIFTYQFSWDQKHNYLDTKFIESIQGKKDLLFLIENKYYKKFGFFSPLEFDSQNNGWVQNLTCKPMIFSLDGNQSEFITNTSYLQKYDSKNRKISIGGIYEKQNNQDGKKFGIQIDMGLIPRGEINLQQMINSGGGLFGQSQSTQLQSQYKVINGYQKGSSFFNFPQLLTLEVYKVQTPQIQQSIITN